MYMRYKVSTKYKR